MNIVNDHYSLACAIAGGIFLYKGINGALEILLGIIWAIVKISWISLKLFCFKIKERFFN